jgi:hypothetical protein
LPTIHPAPRLWLPTSPLLGDVLLCNPPHQVMVEMPLIIQGVAQRETPKML